MGNFKETHESLKQCWEGTYGAAGGLCAELLRVGSETEVLHTPLAVLMQNICFLLFDDK